MSDKSLQQGLQKLEEMLSSSDEEKQFRAIDRIIRIFFARSGRNGSPIILQHFGIQANGDQQPAQKSLNEVIVEERKRRGLPPLEQEED
jgi:hypothetical protein